MDMDIESEIQKAKSLGYEVTTRAFKGNAINQGTLRRVGNKIKRDYYPYIDFKIYDFGPAPIYILAIDTSRQNNGATIDFLVGLEQLLFEELAE